jgi:hypothetical protein
LEIVVETARRRWPGHALGSPDIAEPRASIKQRAFPITRPAADAPVAVFVFGFALPKAESCVITIGAGRTNPAGRKRGGNEVPAGCLRPLTHNLRRESRVRRIFFI